MKFKTTEEYRKEIVRVQEARAKTTSPRLRSDYGKYLKRLQYEMRGLQREVRQ